MLLIFFTICRLMPALMLSLALYATGYRYLGSGPLFPTDINDANTCREGYWWKNLLMLWNLVDTQNMV